jgi:hypothetical protein
MLSAERFARAQDTEHRGPPGCDAEGFCPPLVLPFGFSLSVERLFGQTSVERSRELSDGSRREDRFESFNFFAAQTPHEGYSSPRLASDYFFSFGLTAGGAVGYHAVQRAGRSTSVWVLAPRLGYFWRFSPYLGLWPRAGLTWLSISGEIDDTEDELAASFELPLVILVQQQLGLLLQPHFELGLPGGTVQLHERCVQVGAAVFF